MKHVFHDIALAEFTTKLKNIPAIVISLDGDLVIFHVLAEHEIREFQNLALLLLRLSSLATNLNLVKTDGEIYVAIKSANARSGEVIVFGLALHECDITILDTYIY